MLHYTSLATDELLTNNRQQSVTQLNSVAPTKTTSSSALETAGCSQKRIESLTTEIAQLKSKLDGLILEKNSYKCKNEELTSDLNSLKQSLEHSKASSNAQNNAPAKKTEAVAVACEARSTQTPSHAKHSSGTQTLVEPAISIVQSSTVAKTDAKVDQLKKELDHFKIKFAKEQSELNAQLDDKNLELKRLEDTIKHLLKQIDELNTKLSESIANADLMQKSHDEQLVKLNGNFKIEKQISDTIIQQQKKLLYYLQMKMNGELPVESSSNSDKNSDHHHNGHHNQHSKKFKFKNKSSHSNPLLANLHKTTDQRFIGKQQPQSASKSSANGSGKEASAELHANKKLNEIESELNSNYEVYSSMSAKNRMELNKYDRK